MSTQLGVGLIGALFGIGELGHSVAGQVANVTLNLPNSRQAETEADRIGIELAARAGYDPNAAVTLWEKMSKLAGGQPPKWLSTHPPHEDRINDLRIYAQKVMPLYTAAKGSAAAGK
jgi:predicted Zn-dependent protease